MTFWDQVRSLFGLEESRTAQTVATTVQVLLIALATILAARWARERTRSAAKARGATADVASIAARTVVFVVVVTGIAIILSVVGLNPTAIAAILGAATFGISLALQDVAKAIVNGVYVLIERPFRIGDRIRVENVEGRVEEIGIRLTFVSSPAVHRSHLERTLRDDCSRHGGARSGKSGRRRGHEPAARRVPEATVATRPLDDNA